MFSKGMGDPRQILSPEGFPAKAPNTTYYKEPGRLQRPPIFPMAGANEGTAIKLLPGVDGSPSRRMPEMNDPLSQILRLLLGQ